MFWFYSSKELYDQTGHCLKLCEYVILTFHAPFLFLFRKEHNHEAMTSQVEWETIQNRVWPRTKAIHFIPTQPYQFTKIGFVSKEKMSHEQVFKTSQNSRLDKNLFLFLFRIRVDIKQGNHNLFRMLKGGKFEIQLTF